MKSNCKMKDKCDVFFLYKCDGWNIRQSKGFINWNVNNFK